MNNIIKNAVKKTTDWVLYSGIQNTEGGLSKIGGFNSWFDTEKKNYRYIYSEITGYGLTTLAYLYSKSSNPLFKERAVLAGDWVLNNALHETGGVYTRYYLENDREENKYSFDSGMLYAFDAGMVLFGIARLYEITGEKRFLKAAVKIGDFLTDKCQKEDGSIFAVYDSKKGELISNNEKWSTQSGSFHAKAAMGLYSLYEITMDKKYLAAALKLCDRSLAFQKESGRFVSFSDIGATHLHPHSYSCEGLMYIGIKLKNKDYIASAAKGIIWALDNALKKNHLHYLYIGGRFNEYERVDALSQIFRLASYSLQKGYIEDFYQQKLDYLTENILSYQHVKDEQSGGFFYGFSDMGEKLPHINSWCSMFALQALDFYNDLLNDKKISIDYLV